MMNENGQKYFINERGEKQILGSQDEINDFIDVEGRCKYCKTLCMSKRKSTKFDVSLDENGEKYIIDKDGNKIYVRYNAQGQMYYIDAQGIIQFVEP